MSEIEIEYNKEITEIKNSTPIIDFIFTPICDSFELGGKLIYIQY